ncbi:hypothetical protein NQZ68_001025 [Dissostichus eleginoides]|nr:hypothetical protein NQZ68_001025 [Dissostichus eleginoides]
MDSNPAKIWFLALNSSGTPLGTPMLSMYTVEPKLPLGTDLLAFVDLGCTPVYHLIIIRPAPSMSPPINVMACCVLHLSTNNYITHIKTDRNRFTSGNEYF